MDREAIRNFLRGASTDIRLENKKLDIIERAGTAIIDDNDCVKIGQTEENNECDDNDCGGGVVISSPPKCEFKRGVCKEHNMKGKKEVIKSKTWTKLKFGYGWRTNQKVRYSCTYMEQNLIGGNYSPRGSGLSTSLSGNSSRGLVDLGTSNLSTILSGSDRIKHESESQGESSGGLRRDITTGS